MEAHGWLWWKGKYPQIIMERSFLRNCFVFCEFISQSTAFSSRSRSLRPFLWNFQRDIWKPIEAYGEKENILRWKPERSFLRICFVMCDFHSLSNSCISWSCLLAFFVWNRRTDISKPFEEYRAKGNILWWKWERSFLRNFFVICEFISQSYSFPLKKPLAKTVLVKFAKWYFEAHGGLWWKGKYPQMKTGKKLSEKLLCVLWIHLTELQLSTPEAVRQDCSCGICKGIFGNA